MNVSLVPAGIYHAVVGGQDIGTSETNRVAVTGKTRRLEVRVRPGIPAGNSLISVVRLGVSPQAEKEFSSAERLIAKRDWDSALAEIHKGLVLDPNYAAGYNNLGVIYSHLGSTTEAREALRVAVRLDDRFVPAYVNLGRLSITNHNFRGAQVLLNKAVTLAPPDAGILSLLAYAQFMGDRLDEAMDTCQRAHLTLGTQHGFLHLLAAHIYQRRHAPDDAIAELRLYLAEEPDGPDAEETQRAVSLFESSR